MSILVPIKHLKASVGVQTIGSPLTLKEVFTIKEQFVISLNLLISEWYFGLVSL